MKGGFRTDLRKKIIEEALVLFERYGFHGVTVNQIVDKTGTSKGGFYHHFTSKDELLFVIHDEFITYALEKATIANETYDDPIKKLQAIIKDFVKTFGLYKPHISVFYQENIYLKPEYEIRIKKKRDQFKQIMMNALSEGKEAGEFRDDVPVDITAMAILGMVNWTYKWYQSSGTKSIDEIGSIYVDLILHAVLKPDSFLENTYQELLLSSVKRDFNV
ncbi:transcriptional regulator, TetR family [Lentibacillus halodurans]|uniref:Transcriptional regulator, TetR family n=1 Tax=Lentibacillus halodurans TaxID=237679 RepID=A0A1I0VGW9_9BACI|nr:TetR/AcrR family transcriptional regulator [Lentibacillus halodurans]SFA75273.1 transcriptional regulator, TetR family [Lentibacillus halodurans]